jgi:hypothetical protein
VSVDGQFFSPNVDQSAIEAANAEAMDHLRQSTSHEFDASPMRKLKAEYERMDENLEDATESTKQGATMLTLKGSLEERDLFDRGEVRQPWEPRYGLVQELFLKVDRIVGEMQHFLSRAASLVPGRSQYFHIDPEDSIVPILRGCSNVSQLVAAWEIIRSRIELGQKFLLKYEDEFYSADAGRSPALSPTSTTVELEEGLKTLDGGDEKMRHMVTFYPHHSIPGLRDDQRARILKEEWNSLVSWPRSWSRA